MSISKRIDQWRSYFHRLLAAEISAISRFFDVLVQWKPDPETPESLFELCQAPKKVTADATGKLPAALDNAEFPLLLLQGNFNHSFDILGDLAELRPYLNRNARLAVILYNPYLRLAYLLANLLGVRRGRLPETFITETALLHLVRLAQFEVVRSRPLAYFPFPLLGVGSWLNRILSLIPGAKYFAVAGMYILRPCTVAADSAPSLSIVIPARNERGNIAPALQRIPEFSGIKTEVIFVEGHSNDGTWEEIEKVRENYRGPFTVSSYRQTGKGKADAVRLGFAKAEHELLVILDADLSTPPELLPQFYEAYRRGVADFINGNRLVYPMEGEAMRFLNRLGNIFFAKALSFVLRQRLGDSLCGTKLVSRKNYGRMMRWRVEFPAHDPFGDYELLFPAAELALGIVDIPVHYLARAYGSTNIHRFYHGWQLFELVMAGLNHIYLPKQPALPNPQPGNTTD